VGRVIVFGFLPLVALVLLWLRSLSSDEWREAVVAAAVSGGLLVLVGTEGLSLIGQLRFLPLALFWSTVSIGAALAVFMRKPIKQARIPRLNRTIAIASVPLVAVAGTTLLVALVAPPNTVDSMTYHMARVAHWVYQGSVNDYPTETLRQLSQPPWAEFAIAHLQVLTGGDRFANLVQWSCMVGSLIGVSLIARELGACVRGQYFAALMAATLPMGILQASSTQNDYVEAFWIVCAVFYTLRMRTQSTVATTSALGASVGLALLTKGTAYIYTFPILAVAAWWLLRRYKVESWRPLAVLTIIVLAINASAWLRNISVFASIFGPRETYTNQVFSAPALASNIVRDVSVQIGTPFKTVNDEIARAISEAHWKLGIGLNDPRTTFQGVHFQVNSLRPDEDSTPNPIHFLLLVLAAVITLTHLRRLRMYAIYLGGLLGAFLLFALWLRWQPWHSRLELPLTVLATPFTAGVFSVIWSRRVIAAICGIPFFAAIPWLLGPSIRPLIGPRSIFLNPRSAIYFYARPELRGLYQETADLAHLAGCRVIGIDGNDDSWEYPLWVYLGKNCHVVPVHPVPGTEHLGQSNAQPCATLIAP
jgi:4-amino-4-deoxy-L-arabinose transferase-like glycosyltransferase